MLYENMSLRTITFLAASILTSASLAEARPVSYPDGWTIMLRNNGNFSSQHLHWSATASESIGIYNERNWQEDFQFTGLQYNRLLKRWNSKGSQANTYLKLGAGVAKPFEDGTADFSTFAEFAADWETRRWFTSYSVRAIDWGENETIRHSSRLGVAPYIGDAGDLHTWLMLQVNNLPDADETLQTTPLVRFFYGAHLFEAGYTLESNELLLNWIIRF